MNASKTFLLIAVLSALSAIVRGQEVEREYVIDDRGRERAFSRAVATTGGKTVWLAGQTTTEDADGNSLAGNFEGQAREIFRLLDARLAEFGGSLADIVTMTVYIGDTRYGDQFVELRKEFFSGDRFPSSALITVVGFARPDILLEVKATAVVEAD
jgi:enamine deaminase RidA (YjgF/YER057c/UK114 family)